MKIELSRKEAEDLLTMLEDESHLQDLWPVLKVLEKKIDELLKSEHGFKNKKIERIGENNMLEKIEKTFSYLREVVDVKASSLINKALAKAKGMTDDLSSVRKTEGTNPIVSFTIKNKPYLIKITDTGLVLIKKDGSFEKVVKKL